jgi:hypothetical protein
MKKVETLFLKLVIIHFVFLFIAQWVILQTDVASYLNKTIEYEGVITNENGQTIQTFETIDQ